MKNVFEKMRKLKLLQEEMKENEAFETFLRNNPNTNYDDICEAGFEKAYLRLTKCK